MRAVTKETQMAKASICIALLSMAYRWTYSLERRKLLDSNVSYALLQAGQPSSDVTNKFMEMTVMAMF